MSDLAFLLAHCREPLDDLLSGPLIRDLVQHAFKYVREPLGTTKEVLELQPRARDAVELLDRERVIGLLKVRHSDVDIVPGARDLLAGDDQRVGDLPQRFDSFLLVRDPGQKPPLSECHPDQRVLFLAHYRLEVLERPHDGVLDRCCIFVGHRRGGMRAL